MTSADAADLEKQIKETGKQLSHPPHSVDQLLSVLDVSPNFGFVLKSS